MDGISGIFESLIAPRFEYRIITIKYSFLGNNTPNERSPKDSGLVSRYARFPTTRTRQDVDPPGRGPPESGPAGQKEDGLWRNSPEIASPDLHTRQI